MTRSTLGGGIEAECVLEASALAFGGHDFDVVEARRVSGDSEVEERG